ncbi:MAG TPA: hypothetical protein VMK65_02000 [Longimicrobiales bacterium]|nr:hypothetical protein [Longimicrobiales bacterium]
MSLPPLHGHGAVRASLAAAARTGELPGSLLIHGPPGVGKQRLALWLAQQLLCERPGPEGPCDACTPCRLARRVEHPDLNWFFPLPRPKGASSPEKLADLLEEARGEELAARRADPLRVGRSGEVVGIYLAQVHTLRRLAGTRPAMARRKIIVVGDAEAMVPQEASPEAANAFLKVLEEPPPDTFFLLTSADPEALLPTIRSRVLPVRLRELPEAEVQRFLEEHRGASPGDAALAARLSGGAIGRALGFLPEGDGPGPHERVRAQARALLEAAAAGGATRLAAAHAQSPAGSRGEFADVLAALGTWVRDLAAVAADAREEVVNADALPALDGLAERLPRAAASAAEALRAVDIARELARGNVNPQLTTAWLLRVLGEALTTGAPAAEGAGTAAGAPRA